MNEDTKLRLLNIGSAAEYLGISIDTLRRWEKKGRIIPLRSPGGHRYYSKEDLDALFGKRYTRDEETLRRTNEELGKSDTSLQTPQLPTNLSSVVSTSEEVLAKEGLPSEEPNPNTPITNPVAIPSWRPVPVEDIPQNPTVTQEQKDTPGLLHPIESQPEAFSGKSVPESLGVIPKTDVPSYETISESAEKPQTAPVSTDRPTPSVLLPQKEDEAYKSEDRSTPLPPAQNREQDHPQAKSDPIKDNNVLSEEEIEKRINTIINKEEKRSFSNIVLGIVSFVMFAADVILLYIWFSSSRITSPIP